MTILFHADMTFIHDYSTCCPLVNIKFQMEKSQVPVDIHLSSDYSASSSVNHIISTLEFTHTISQVVSRAHWLFH